MLIRYARWFVAIALIGPIACSAPETVDTRPNNTTGATTTTASDTSTTTPEVATLTLDEGLPRSASYSFIDVTITDAVLGNIEPGSYLTDSWKMSEENFLVLGLTVRNNSNADTANWPPNPFSLQIGDERTGPPQMLAGRPHIGLTSLQTTDLVMAFPVSEGQEFEEVSLVVAQDGRIPMALPLTGPIPELEYPIAVDATAAGHIQGGCGQDVEVTTLGAWSKIDLLDTPSPTSYGARRANLGERFLTIALQVQNHGGKHCGGGATNFGIADVRLNVDGLSYAPVAGLTQTIAANSVAEMDFHFVYAVGSQNITLVIGDEEELHLAELVDVSIAPMLTIEE